jgi:hypothetical protein
MPLPSGLGNCAKFTFAISYKIRISIEITLEKDINLKKNCHKKMVLFVTKSRISKPRIKFKKTLIFVANLS